MAKIDSNNTLEKILENGIIAISRGNYGDTLLRAVDAAARGGIKAVEITFEQNLAPEIAGEALDKLVRRFGTVLAVGAGTVLTVLCLLLTAGYNDTAYYPSLTDMQSSLTISNSSSSLFTLRTMAWVSLFVPFVAAYIWYAWRAMNRRPITREEIRGDDHQY